MSSCPEYDRLAKNADQALRDLLQTATLLHELFHANQPEKFMSLDKEFELLVGQKERALGALRQHAQEHKCQEFANRAA